MDSVITGKVWKFGDDINTDIISPAEYMDASYEVIGKHAMERAFPGFADAIARGDIIVAGKKLRLRLQPRDSADCSHLRGRRRGHCEGLRPYLLQKLH